MTSVDELETLARVRLSLAPEAPLELALPHLSQTDARSWEGRLNREWTACGCRQGEIAAAVAIVSYVAAAVLGMAPAVDSAWGHAGWATIAALVGAAAGKVIGRARSLARFRRLTRELQYSVEAQARAGRSSASLPSYL